MIADFSPAITVNCLWLTFTQIPKNMLEYEHVLSYICQAVKTVWRLDPKTMTYFLLFCFWFHVSFYTMKAG